MQQAGTRAANFGEYRAQLKGRVDAELQARVGEWFPEAATCGR